MIDSPDLISYNMIMKKITEIDIKKVPSYSEIARTLGVDRQVVWAWFQPGRRVPAERVAALAKATGLSRDVFRPDLFDEASFWQSLKNQFRRTRKIAAGDYPSFAEKGYTKNSSSQTGPGRLLQGRHTRTGQHIKKVEPDA